MGKGSQVTGRSPGNRSRDRNRAKAELNQRSIASNGGPTKTPLYSAFNAARYARQDLIKKIEDVTKRKLICYVASGEINRTDTMFFVDMLHNIPQRADIDLMLHTPGGDVDAAEKLIMLLRARATEEGVLNVVVPDYAKSSGTLMALGANSIIMSDTSELGTIDPQFITKDRHGNEVNHSVLDYLASYEEFQQQLRESPDDIGTKMMFDKFDPATLHKYRSVQQRARTFGENQLKRRGANFSKIVTELMDTSRFPSHGQMINWEHAKDMGLPVQYLAPNDSLWTQYWALFCQYRIALQEHSKVYESAYASHFS